MEQIGFKTQTLAAQKKDGSGIKLSQVVVVQPPKRDATDIGVWKNAMKAADRGKRKALVELYNNLLIDTVLSDAVDKRIRNVTNAEWVFLSNGDEIPEMADFIDTPEFEELLEEIMLSKFYGKSIIELKFDDSKFDIYSVPRQNLNTKEKGIYPDVSDDGKLISYENDPFILNIGKDEDLGLFLKTAPHAIFKRNGGADYAQFCELFGIPILAGYYDPDDETGRQEMETSFEKRGAGGSVVMSNKSKLESLEGGRGKESVHRGFLDYCDEQILIGVVSQTMTTKDGSSLAQGKVHEDTEDDLIKADRRKTRRLLNKLLLPILEKRGYPVKNGFFKTVEKDKTTLKEKLDIAVKVDEKIEEGVDDEYFYETFGLPKGNKAADRAKAKAQFEQDPEQKEVEEDPDNPEPDPKDEKKPKPVKKAVKAKELSLFEKLKYFFGHAPQ